MLPVELGTYHLDVRYGVLQTLRGGRGGERRRGRVRDRRGHQHATAALGAAQAGGGRGAGRRKERVGVKIQRVAFRSSPHAHLSQTSNSRLTAAAMQRREHRQLD